MLNAVASAERDQEGLSQDRVEVAIPTATRTTKPPRSASRKPPRRIRCSCDPERRAQYDRFGHAALRAGRRFRRGFDFAAGGFEEIFGDIFGDFFGGPRRGRSRTRRGEDLRYDLEISFEEAVFGAEKTVRVPRLVACEDCKGSGSKNGAPRDTCSACRGSGQLRFQQGLFSIAKTCGQCQGQGTVLRDPCRTCGGGGARAQRSRRSACASPPVSIPARA